MSRIEKRQVRYAEKQRNRHETETETDEKRERDVHKASHTGDVDNVTSAILSEMGNDGLASSVTWGTICEQAQRRSSCNNERGTRCKRERGHEKLI